MEEAIWIAIGVIAVIIAVGIISQLVVRTNEDSKLNSIDSSIASLKQKCDFVCNNPVDTRLSVTVPIASGAVLTAKGNKMCIFIKDKVACDSCKCSLINETILDLNNTQSLQLFRTHDYSCYFTKLQNENIKVECRG